MFLNLALAGGLLAVSIPILVHLAHRRKMTPVQWGAMRFLLAMMRQRRRRIFVDQWLLLAIRTLAILCLALAFMRPAWQPDAAVLEQNFVLRQGRVAAVLLFDDSASTGAGRGESSLAKMKTLALAYLDTLSDGDEISLVRLSRLDDVQSDPLFDRQAIRDQIQAIAPTGVSSDIPALLEAGFVQLTRHLNPSAELILIHDGVLAGWREDARTRWGELRERFARNQIDPAQARSQPRLISLSARRTTVFNNVAIAAVRLDRALVPVGQTAHILVTLIHTGRHVADGMFVRLSVNGRQIAHRSLLMAPGKQQEISFSHRFMKAGSHTVMVELIGAQDAFAVDDRRVLAIEVNARIPVLLVEAQARRENRRGALYYLAAALDPGGDGSLLFQPKRIGVGQLIDTPLEGVRVIVLGNVPALGAAAISQLERFVVSGGGLLVAVGDQTKTALVNRAWARGGDGFLPCALGAERTLPRATRVATIRHSHRAFRAFREVTNTPWTSGRVRRYFKLDTRGVALSSLDVLATLDTGEPLLVERSRGLGRVILMTSSLDLAWNDLAGQTFFVPMFRGVVEHLAGRIVPLRNLQPGERLCYRGALQNPQVEGPGGKTVLLSAGAWEGRNVFQSAPLTVPGIYTVHDANQERPIHYTVAIAPAESRLAALTSKHEAEILSGMNPVQVSQAGDVPAVFRKSQRQTVELWRWFLLAGVLFLFAETVITRQQARGSMAFRGSMRGA